MAASGAEAGPAAAPTRAASDAGIARRNLLRADADLTGAVDTAVARAARVAGPALVCRPGCSECCIGPFPITRLDAWRLREGLEALQQSDSARAARILERARAAVEALRDGFPGDAGCGLLQGDEEAEDRFLERHSELPCPVLDPATQTCELYAHRPVSCRTYGPPVRFNGQDLPPCRLCFTTSEPQQIEAARVEPDKAKLERAILDRLKRDDGESRETLIAWAVQRTDL
ncbi:MAG TPA: YkgJ family cysteine cluster protein [Candidatus Polarisedimenticolia bacterium]|nr:YkgJ family cysteine cluster protein [Candidatus Polarisedimenticolia bacterium]